MQTPTKQQGAPQNYGKSTPKRRKRGKKGDPGSRPEKGKAHPGSAQAAPIFLAWCKSGPALFPGGGYQRLRQLSPPEMRCASVPDGRGPGWCAGRWRCPASSRGPLRDVIDALERSSLRIPQNQLPDGIGDVACLGGLAESEPGHLLVHDGDVPQRGRGLHPAVVLQPLLHPAVVEALRRQLQDGLAGPDLEEAGAPSPGTPVPLTILAHPPGLPFCLRDEFPQGDGAQDQATLHVRPEDMLHLHRMVLLPVVLTHHTVDVFRRDGKINDPLIALTSPGADVRAIGTCPAPRGGGVQAHQLDHVVGVAELAVDGGGH